MLHQNGGWVLAQRGQPRCNVSQGEEAGQARGQQQRWPRFGGGHTYQQYPISTCPRRAGALSPTATPNHAHLTPTVTAYGASQNAVAMICVWQGGGKDAC